MIMLQFEELRLELIGYEDKLVDLAEALGMYFIDENGNRVFRGNAWINNDFYNEIKVLIRRNNIWIYVGSLNYIVYPEK